MTSQPAAAALALLASLGAAAAASLTVPALAPYPGYEGGLHVSALEITILEEGSGVQVLAYRLAGIDPRCTAAANASGLADACGIHIHEGGSCSNAGGRLWNKTLLGSGDPWAHVRYATVDGKAAAARQRVVTGLTNDAVRGRTLDVHDVTGARVSCSLIQEVPTLAPAGAEQPAATPRSEQAAAPPRVELAAAPLDVYPGYAGDLRVTGPVAVGERGSGVGAMQVLSFALRGTDPRCTAGANLSGVANACGIHIHEGRDCADAGGHLWNRDLLGPQDPWASVTYETLAGEATGAGVEVVTGLSSAEAFGRTLVVHDATGARVSCGLLGYPEDAAPAGPVTPPAPFPAESSRAAHLRGAAGGPEQLREAALDSVEIKVKVRFERFADAAVAFYLPPDATVPQLKAEATVQRPPRGQS